MLSQINSMLQPLQQVNASQVETIIRLTRQIQNRLNELTAQVAWLNRQLFGHKSEKLPSLDSNQPDLFGDFLPDNAAELEKACEAAAQTITKETVENKKRERNNRRIMGGLSVLERVIIEPEDIDLELYRKIGEEVTRVVEHKPGQLYIREIVRPKYALKDNTSLPPVGRKGVEIAAMPLLPIYKGIAGPTLLAEILLQKYKYHLPFYRQVKQLHHLGFKASESTIDGWFKPAVELLKPLYGVLRQEIMKSDYIQGDETTVPVLDKAGHQTNKEYL